MIKFRTVLFGVVAALTSGNLLSCSGVNSTSKSLYALDPGRPNAPADPAAARQSASNLDAVSREQVLQVRRVSIAPPFDGLTLIHRAPDGTYAKDYYSEWVAPPEELLSTQLVDWLSSSAPFASVVDGRSAAPHRFALETCISSFYGDFTDPAKPTVVITARLYLIDDSAGSRAVAYQNHYNCSVPVGSASPEQLALGSGRAYRLLLEAITQDLLAFRVHQPPLSNTAG
jgi:cholesterol transport system auxiliary component